MGESESGYLEDGVGVAVVFFGVVGGRVVGWSRVHYYLLDIEAVVVEAGEFVLEYG